MIFTDWVFPLFLGVVFAVHWTLPRGEIRLMWLLLASLVFYGWWDVRFLALIGFVILVSWAIALRVGDLDREPASRKRWLVAGVAINLSVLGVFKYFGFFTDTAEAGLASIGIDPGWPLLNIILPVGISFYIFQAISYLIDVYRLQLNAEHRLRRVAVYISFFPQLVAGPIVRAAGFFPQMDHDRRLSHPLLAAGMKAFVLGLVYKAGLADNIAPVVNEVFGNLDAYDNPALVGATIAFGAQIYFDFAGYSLMAIGVARWFGFYIPRNFDYPYLSTSIAEFWRRWHISLSSWLRDYLYIPLGGNRHGEVKTYRNLFLTMLLGGLWHGAAWTFVVWGALHGAALSVHRRMTRRADGSERPILGGVAGFVFGLVLTQVFVFAVWVPFRAETFGDMVTVWSAAIGMREGGEQSVSPFVFAIPLLLLADGVLGKTRLRHLAKARLFRTPMVYWGGLGALTAILLALYPLNPAPFIYFQF